MSVPGADGTTRPHQEPGSPIRDGPDGHALPEPPASVGSGSDPIEEGLRLHLEEFLDLRRRALTPRPDDPPAHPIDLAAAGLLMLDLVVRQGTGWALALHRQRLLARKARTGPSATGSGPGSGEASERSFLASVIQTGGIVPPELRDELAAALLALDHGEVRPLLAPIRTGRWRDPYNLARLRLEALLHVHLRWGRGSKKAAAEAEVAAALATSRANVRKWERTWLPEIVGDIRDKLALARRAGRLARKYPEGLPEGQNVDRWLLDHLERERTLTALAREHDRLMRASADR